MTNGKRSVLVFFIATLGITWGFQLPALLAYYGLIAGPPERYMLPAGIALFGPLLGAILAAKFESGSEGIRALFRPLRDWRVARYWYVVALAMSGTILFLGMATYALAGGDIGGPWFYPPLPPQRIVFMVVISVIEEVGWRGFALPRLQQRYGSLNGSLILGLVWGAWHVPMFLLVDIRPDTLPIMIPFFMAGSLAFTWLYERTGGSLVIAIFAHMGAHLNNSHRPLPDNLVPLVAHTVAYLVLALVLVLVDRKVWRRSRVLAPASP